MWRPKTGYEPGLAAVKHAQGLAEREAQGERYRKAESALAGVQAAAKAEWPEAMRRELAACRTAEDNRLWSERWAEQIAGRVADVGFLYAKVRNATWALVIVAV